MFNECYYTIDNNGILLTRWMDNNLVFMVSTCHQIGSNRLVNRKKPRLNQVNKGHVEKVWGDKGSKMIHIPSMVDDYNHWMGGVDLADQRIANYHPDIRCHRTWIPIFLQCLSIMRNNMFLVFKRYHDDRNPKKKLKQKDFVLEMVSVLMKKAENARKQNLHLPPLFIDPISLDFSSPLFNSQSTTTSVPNSQLSVRPRSSRASRTAAPSKVPPRIKKSTQISLHSFQKRLHLPLSLHISSTKGNKRSRCVYCSIKYQERDEDDVGRQTQWTGSVSRTQCKCNYCGVFLCSKHFDSFHSDF